VHSLVLLALVRRSAILEEVSTVETVHTEVVMLQGRDFGIMR